MPTERLADRARIVTHFAVEQSFVNEPVELRFAYLEPHAAQALSSALPVQAHACGGWAWLGNDFVHGSLSKFASGERPFTFVCLALPTAYPPKRKVACTTSNNTYTARSHH
jgi:hypothetical protein